MKLRDILRAADAAAPFALAQSWDNVGLMVGDLDAEVGRVGVALDPIPEAVAEAAEKGCQALICHHPLLFHPVRKLDLGSDPAAAVREAIKRDVAVIALHTNWDCVIWGVNAELARLIGLEEPEPLDDATGLGRIGNLSEPEPMMKFLERVKKSWGLSYLDCRTDEPDKTVFRAALCGGSGGDLWPAAKVRGADVYITSDMKYHEMIDAARAGLSVAITDHGETERASLPEMVRRLRDDSGVDAILLGAKALMPPIKI